MTISKARFKRQSEDEVYSDDDTPEGRHLHKLKRKFRPNKQGILSGCRKNCGGIFGGGYGGYGGIFGG